MSTERNGPPAGAGTGLVLGSLLLSGCILFDDQIFPEGSTGDTSTSSADGGGWGTTQSSTSTTSQGGSGGGGSTSESSSSTGQGGDCPDLGSDENCGACGWSCGADSSCDGGVCTPARIVVGQNLFNIEQSGDFVLTARVDSDPDNVIESWHADHWSAPVDQETVYDAGGGGGGRGTLCALGNRVLYAPQLAESAVASLDVCDLDQVGMLKCNTPIPFDRGLQVNGMAIASNGIVALTITESDPSIRRLYSFDTAILSAPPSPLPLHVMADNMQRSGEIGGGTSTANPIPAKVNPGGPGEVYWGTYHASENCIYSRAATVADCAACKAMCIVGDGTSGIPGVFEPMAGGAGVFVSTYTNGGPVYQVDLTPPTATNLSSPANDFRGPIAVDDHYLYMTQSIGSKFDVVAYDPVAKTIVAHVNAYTDPDPLHPKDPHPNAMHVGPDYLYFSVADELVRWRKPPPPVR